MNTQMTWELESIKGKFGNVIDPEDEVWTFTSVYGGRSIAINRGVFKGVKKTTVDGKKLHMPEYVVERPDGSLTRIQYAKNIAPIAMTLEDLDGECV